MRPDPDGAAALTAPLLVLVTGLPGTGKSRVADAAGATLGAAVLAHDWAMSGLRPFPEVQRALDATEPPGHRDVGWSILLALARSELRRGRPAVLDGVARAPEVERCARLSADEGATLLLVATRCSDESLHRERVAARRRSIPGWHELGWADVERAARTFETPAGADLVLDAARPWDHNQGELQTLLG